MGRTKGKRKKKTNRSKAKYPGLEKRFTSRIRQEYLDYDYLDKLSDKDKEWLNNFTEEYLGANFKHPGKKMHKRKREQRELYNNNNARNRCAYGTSKVTGSVINYDFNELHELIEGQQSVNETNYLEEALIEFIDSKTATNAPDESSEKGKKS